MSEQKVVSLDGHRLKNSPHVKEVWEKNYRGWCIVFVKRSWENHGSKRDSCWPKNFFELSWYARHEDKNGVMREWGEIADNDRIGGPETIPWIIVEGQARGHVDQFEGPQLIQEEHETWGEYRS